MSRGGLRLVHAAGGGLAMVTIVTFWVSTIAVELAGSPDSIVAVKQAIPWGLLVLVPAMAATGITGMRLTRNAKGRLVRRKLLRMRVVGALVALVLVPCVLYLGLTTSADGLDATFYSVQTVELAAGAVNITLLGLNTRDGLRLTGRLRRRPRPGPGPAVTIPADLDKDQPSRPSDARDRGAASVHRAAS